jgi:hypothetical protein
MNADPRLLAAILRSDFYSFVEQSSRSSRPLAHSFPIGTSKQSHTS